MRIDRLKELLNHMLTERGHDEFAFKDFSYQAPGCKTCGCMAGELPYLYPGVWEFTKSIVPDTMLVKLVKSDRIATGMGSVTDELKAFFDLSELQVGHLFYPGQQWHEFGSMLLLPDSSLQEVTANLKEFIARAEAGLIT